MALISFNSMSEGPTLALDGADFSLWTRRFSWQCADGRLLVQVIAAEELTVPEVEPTEPVVGALARWMRHVPGERGMLALLNPAEALGAERMPLAQGIHLLGIGSEADEACWDAALSQGIACYGLRGTVTAEVGRCDARALILALRFGCFTCHEGFTLRLDEQRDGVSWSSEQDGSVSVIVRGGFEAGQLSARAGEWRDTGSEGYVRLVASGADGRCWTQPRLVMPRSASHG